MSKRNEPEASSKMVSMRFQPDTVDNVDYLRHATGISNRTELTAKSIALAKWWVESQQKGGKVYFENPDGEREVVVMPGLQP